MAETRPHLLQRPWSGLDLPHKHVQSIVWEGEQMPKWELLLRSEQEFWVQRCHDCSFGLLQPCVFVYSRMCQFRSLSDKKHMGGSLRLALRGTGYRRSNVVVSESWRVLVKRLIRQKEGSKNFTNNMTSHLYVQPSLEFDFCHDWLVRFHQMFCYLVSAFPCETKEQR